ncbi:adenylate/guanylate cyclase domain-containing protein, partial [Streptomyces sp.]|uniref:adenylate/guanylate cyclase domain-containing protein n=1 Tax=Streptomyces sp. TaxID=1931 RepID=UPI002F4BB668
MQCHGCAHELPDDARFCSSCGTPQGDRASARVADERKLVTVVFCDLVGSTALSGRLDPETLRTVTLRYFELIREQIESHGGTVEKFIGDAVMAVFGVPTVREDDARRALAAALGMVGALDGLNARLDAELGVRLNVRIGVNTGRVVATSDVTARQALVSGETVNVAARLEQNARAGEILIGPDTLLAAGPGVSATATEPLQLKGKSEPVTAHRLLAVEDDDPAVRRRFDVPFVGRRRELDVLDAALAEVTARRRVRQVRLYGEAGIGKSRLLGEWLASVAPRALYGTGRCQTYGTHGSLSPLADAVRQLLPAAERARGDADRAPDRPAGRDQAHAVLAGGLLRDGTPNPSTAETCAALATLLALTARHRSVVLAIDDCQWASSALTDMLDDLTGRLAHAPVLVLRLARPEPVADGPWLLPGLSATEAAELADHLGAGPQAAQAALSRAGGNPLHLEQLLAGGPDADLPPTLQAVLGARIDALGPIERTLLDLASVLGDEFAGTDLAELADADDFTVRDGLLRLGGRRLVQAAPDGVHRFTSRLVQEVAYQCMTKRTRSAWHERAATLSSVRRAGDGATGSHLERAHHYRVELGLQDAHTERLRRSAFPLLARAGAQALARSDLAWADDLLTRAVALTVPAPARTAAEESTPHPEDPGPRVTADPAEVAARRRLAEVRLALGRPEEGRTLLRETLARAVDPVEAAHARLALAVHDPNRGAGTARVAREVLPVFEERGDHLGQARACLRLAQQYQVEGRHGKAEHLLTRALEQAVRADAEPERAAALGALGVSLWRGPAPAAEAIAHCQALLARHAPGRRTVRVTLNCPLAVLLALNGRRSEAAARLAEAGRLAAELGYAEARVFLPLFTAMVEALADRPQAALAQLAGTRAAAAELGAEGLLLPLALESARNCLTLDDPVAAAAHLTALDGAGPDRAAADQADFAGLQARLAAVRHEPETAVRLAEESVRVAARTDS